MQGRWSDAHARLGSALDGLQAAIERSRKAPTDGNGGEYEGSGDAQMLSEPGGEPEAPALYHYTASFTHNYTEKSILMFHTVKHTV